MPLTQEEIDRIHEEERVRAEARAIYSKKPSPKIEKEIKNSFGIGPQDFFVLALIVISWFVGFILKSGGIGVGLFFILCFYFFPALTAFGKRKENSRAIFIFNLLLGWTIIGWVISLTWASTKD